MPENAQRSLRKRGIISCDAANIGVSLSCFVQAILFERNRTKMFAANQWREVDSKTGKVKTDGDEDETDQQQEPAIEDGSTNLWASNEKIKVTRAIAALCRYRTSHVLRMFQ